MATPRAIRFKPIKVLAEPMQGRQITYIFTNDKMVIAVSAEGDDIKSQLDLYINDTETTKVPVKCSQVEGTADCSQSVMAYYREGSEHEDIVPELGEGSVVRGPFALVAECNLSGRTFETTERQIARCIAQLGRLTTQ